MLKTAYLLFGLAPFLYGTSAAQAESLSNEFNVLKSAINLVDLPVKDNLELFSPTSFRNENNFSLLSQVNFKNLVTKQINLEKALTEIASAKQTNKLFTPQKIPKELPKIAKKSAEPTNLSAALAETGLLNYQTTAEGLDKIISVNNYLVQSPNVSQLRDVQPGDWAYEALRSLVERYGCIVGFPNQTYQGNQAITRYEFAAGLNSCLQQIERLIASSEAVVQEDLATLRRLTQEFEAELAIVAGRVDNLEGRVAFLEERQFSTTTILNGEVIFALADAFGGNPPGGCEQLELTLQNGRTNNLVNCGIRVGNNAISTADDPETNTVFVNLTRLGLQTSFTGKDRLRTFLVTGNFSDGGFTNPESFNTNMSRLSYQGGLDNDVILDILEYRFPVLNDRVAISVIPFGFSLSSVLTANSAYFDIGRGSISRFGQLSSIYRIGGVLDAGAGFDWLISDAVRFQAAYGTANSGDPDEGFFGSDHSSLGVQFLVQPTENLTAGITYVNAYSSDGTLGTFTGSVNAETNGLWSGGRLPDDDLNAFWGEAVEIGDFPAQINAVGGTLQLRVANNLTFGASAAYTFTNFLKEIPEFGGDGDPRVGNPPVAGEEPFANTLTYQFSLGFSDPFGREGDLFAFIFGMPPKLVNAGPTTAGQSVPFFEQVVRDEEPVPITDNDPRAFLREDEEIGDPDNGNLRPEGTGEQFGVEDEATSLHFEFFYRFRVNDNISITPGFFFVTNPGHIEDNDTLYVATIRTTFRF